MTKFTETTVHHIGLSFRICGYFYPGCRERPPSYFSGGEPAEPATFEIHSVWLDQTDITDLFDMLQDYTRQAIEEKVLENLLETDVDHQED